MEPHREKITVKLDLYKDKAPYFFALCYYLKTGLAQLEEVEQEHETGEDSDEISESSFLPDNLELLNTGIHTIEDTLRYFMDCVHIPFFDNLKDIQGKQESEQTLPQPGEALYEEVWHFIKSMPRLIKSIENPNREQDISAHGLICILVQEIWHGRIHLREKDPYWVSASMISPHDLPMPSDLSWTSFMEHMFGTRLAPYEFTESLKHSDKRYVVNLVYNRLRIFAPLKNLAYHTRVLTGFICSKIMEDFCPPNRKRKSGIMSTDIWKKELDKKVSRLLNKGENLEKG